MIDYSAIPDFDLEFVDFSTSSEGSETSSDESDDEEDLSSKLRTAHYEKAKLFATLQKMHRQIAARLSNGTLPSMKALPVSPELESARAEKEKYLAQFNSLVQGVATRFEEARKNLSEAKEELSNLKASQGQAGSSLTVSEPPLPSNSTSVSLNLQEAIKEKEHLLGTLKELILKLKERRGESLNPRGHSEVVDHFSHILKKVQQEKHERFEELGAYIQMTKKVISHLKAKGNYPIAFLIKDLSQEEMRELTDQEILDELEDAKKENEELRSQVIELASGQENTGSKELEERHFQWMSQLQSELDSVTDLVDEYSDRNRELAVQLEQANQQLSNVDANDKDRIISELNERLEEKDASLEEYKKMIDDFHLFSCEEELQTLAQDFECLKRELSKEKTAHAQARALLKKKFPSTDMETINALEDLQQQLVDLSHSHSSILTQLENGGNPQLLFSGM